MLHPEDRAFLVDHHNFLMLRPEDRACRLIVAISLIRFLGQLVAIPGGDMCYFFASGVLRNWM